MKNISIIVAIAKNRAIGKNNKLLWHIPDDLKRFKKLTSGQTIIMGKKTWESLPVKPLPNRRNIVITDNQDDKFTDSLAVFSIDEAIEKSNYQDENFVIGGGSIYQQFMPHAQRLYITQVHQDFDGDIFFPDVNFDDWQEIEKSEVFTNNDGLKYSFVTYQRKN